MPNQDHVCIAITKSNMGGAQKYVLTLADELHKSGKKVTVIAGGDGLLFEKLSEFNISYIKLNQSQRDISIFKEIKLSIELYKIFKQIKPTVLHLNSSKLGGTGAVIGRLAGIKKIIFTAHGWAFNETRPTWQKRFLHVLYWISVFLSTKTICVSKQTREQISHFPFIKNRLITIYNGIQTPEFYEKEEARAILHKMFPALNIQKKWLVILAELHYTKGHDLVFKSIENIKTELAEYQIVCIGEGEREGKLKAIIHHKELEKYVFFTGFVSDASKYLKAFEILILPSRTEALPLTILEAGFAYTPVIASCVGGIPEIIEDSINGFLFEKENTTELEIKLKTLLNLSKEQKDVISNTLHTKISKKFSLQNMINETLDIYS
jgi:glycosyltransferase involved in cell wall biosynthesis